MHSQTVQPSNLPNQPRSRWQKLVAVLAIANLVLVLFNLSYIPFRDVYLRQFSSLVRLYDPVKGIEPHPDTARYLSTVDRLKQLSWNEEAAPAAELLASLRQQSAYLIAENPFLDANKLSTFAQLKRRIEYHLQSRSAEQALATFWSQDYFAQVGPHSAIAFFDRKLRPLLETNYFRRADENGLFIDRFWLIDLGFVVFFGLEFLIRSFWSSRQQNLSWWDAMWRRWYDILFLLPTWRWLRVVPVSVRVHQSGLFNLERIIAQVTYEPAAYLAERVSAFLVVQLINQAQEAVDEGDATRWLLQPKPDRAANEVDELDAFIDRILQLSIYKVVPQIQPNIEALLHHSLRGAFKESNFYQGLQRVPGLEVIPAEITENLADYLAQSAYEVLANSYSDVEGRVLFDNLSQQFKQVLRRELQDKAVQAELQSLLSNLLTQLKLNYVERSANRDPEATLAEAEQLRQEMETQSQSSAIGDQ